MAPLAEFLRAIMLASPQGMPGSLQRRVWVALALSATDPTVRAASLVRVAYVPLMVALVARALTAT